MKVRNIAFSIVVIVILVAPAMLYIATAIGIKIPVEATAEPAKYLSGGYEDANIAKELSLRGIGSKRFQKETEKTIGNNIPFKATAILANAFLQRSSIAASNTIFNFPCYPTYYSSKQIKINNEIVGYIPLKINEDVEKSWRQFKDGVLTVADRNPDKRFIIYVVPGYYEPAYNPAYNLVNKSLHPSNCMNIMFDIEKECSNVKVLTQNYDSEEAYYSNFFKTDHHWNIRGALRAYEQIVDELALNKAVAGSMQDIPDYMYTGATARWGLDLMCETVFDSQNKYDELTAYLPNGEIISCGDHSAFFNAHSLRKPYAYHDLYYDNLKSGTVIKGGVGNKAALLIGNSYRATIQRPLAWSYSQLTVINQLHPSVPITKTLQEQIEESDATDIIFVANPVNLIIDSSYWQ